MTGVGVCSGRLGSTDEARLAGGSPKAGEPDLARLFVQVGRRVRIRLPPAESHANFWSPLALNHDPRHLEADFRAEEPEVRIHLPPPASLRTIGPSALPATEMAFDMPFILPCGTTS